MRRIMKVDRAMHSIGLHWSLHKFIRPMCFHLI